MSDSHNLYKEILDNLYDGIYFVNNERIITYWNRGAAELTGYSEAEVMGKNCHKIFRHVDNQGEELCRGLCPITQTIGDGRIREFDMFLNHKEGHLVPISLRVAQVRDSNDQIVVAVEILGDRSPRYEIRKKMEQLQQLALCDPLTNLANRRFLDINLYARLEEMTRYGWQFGILFIDIDHFKQINDTHGHALGDRVLVMVAKTLLNTVRSFDVLGRWGGEEFIAILINVDAEHLQAIANRFRILVEQSRFEYDANIISVTVSIGATLAQPGDTVSSLVQRADQLMYDSKNKGRNRVTQDVTPAAKT